MVALSTNYMLRGLDLRMMRRLESSINADGSVHTAGWCRKVARGLCDNCGGSCGRGDLSLEHSRDYVAIIADLPNAVFKILC